jgi:hypothetical protein
MGNYSRYKYVNTVFADTDAIVVPNGTTAERLGTELGQIRYNTDIGLVEVYAAGGWQPLDAPPAVTSISGTINENTNSTITVLGSGFKTGSTVGITGAAVNGIQRNLATTFVSSTSLTAATNAAVVNYVGGQVFNVKVTNSSGLSGELTNAGTVDRDPVWVTPAGSLGTVFDSNRSRTFQLSANDPDAGATITYSIISGSLPPGGSLNTSTGLISGPYNAVGSNTTSSFTVRATSSQGSETADRAFSITVNSPVVTTFNATGGSNFSVPSGVTSVRVLVIGGGGGGGQNAGGAGGAGGMVEQPAFPVTPGGSVPLFIGGGGGTDTNGQASTFGSITAIAGGRGTPNNGRGNDGGSGGSSSAGNGTTTGQQPAQGGFSNGFGFGGGTSNSGDGAPRGSGGGGGAGGAGQTVGSANSGGNGGASRNSDITGSSIAYAGGGGGSSHFGGDGRIGGGGGAGNGGFGGGGQPAVANRGSGGGGGNGYGPNGGSGGPGIVVVRY